LPPLIVSIRFCLLVNIVFGLLMGYAADTSSLAFTAALPASRA